MEITELDYYAALDVSPSASLDQIERAYRFALESYGPASLAAYGLLSDEEQAKIVAFLDQARRTLRDERLRREYNRKLEAEGAYPPEQLRFEPSSGETTVGSDTAPELPLAPVEPAAPPPSAAAAPVPAKERGWWPFSEREKEKGAAPADQPAAPAAGTTASPTPAAAPAPPIPALDGRPICGPELRQIREARGIRLEDVSAQTKISISNLKFIEEAKYAFLPAAVYVKGFLRTYAKVLRIDAEKVIRDYMAAFEAHRQA